MPGLSGMRRKRTTHYPLSEGVKKRLCRLQIDRVEPLGELGVDRLEGRQGIGGTALILQQPGKARGGAEFPGQSALPARQVERLPETGLRLVGRSLRAGP